MFVLICFDIVDDRVRYRAVKLLKGHGVRVQKSVFECANMTEHRFLKLKSGLEGVIDHTEDTVRFYPICRACLTNIEFSGVGSPPFTDKFMVT
jgi:CRISPR-associated protein Cas2